MTALDIVAPPRLRPVSPERPACFPGAGGLFISEVWFGWATEEELQPNIDGSSFDEVLLLGLIPGIAAIILTRYATRRRRRTLRMPRRAGRAA